jgi:hypothetical protein
VWKYHVDGDKPWMVDLLPNNPAVRNIANTMLEGPLKKTTRVRGSYTIFWEAQSLVLIQTSWHTPFASQPTWKKRILKTGDLQFGQDRIKKCLWRIIVVQIGLILMKPASPHARVQLALTLQPMAVDRFTETLLNSASGILYPSR